MRVLRWIGWLVVSPLLPFAVPLAALLALMFWCARPTGSNGVAL